MVTRWTPDHQYLAPRAARGQYLCTFLDGSRRGHQEISSPQVESQHIGERSLVKPWTSPIQHQVTYSPHAQFCLDISQQIFYVLHIGVPEYKDKEIRNKRIIEAWIYFRKGMLIESLGWSNNTWLLLVIRCQHSSLHNLWVASLKISTAYLEKYRFMLLLWNLHALAHCLSLIAVTCGINCSKPHVHLLPLSLISISHLQFSFLA